MTEKITDSRYSDEFINRVLEATDLAALIGETTEIRRQGRSVMAVCPFDSYADFSMSVDAARGLYHCFSCGKWGDAIRWIQDTQGVDRDAAIEQLAKRAGIPLAGWK